jgi:hypothetical protein
MLQEEAVVENRGNQDDPEKQNEDVVVIGNPSSVTRHR